MTDRELIAEAQSWLRLCGHCDGGLPMDCTCPTGDVRNLIARLADALESSEDRIAHQQEHQRHCYPDNESDAFCGATHDCPPTETAEDGARYGTCVKCHRRAMGWRHRKSLREAADKLDAEALERFRRGSWLGFLGTYWGWRAAADRLRAQADEAGGAG